MTPVATIRTYAIVNHGSLSDPRLSIDELIDGRYTSQVAFWFTGRSYRAAYVWANARLESILSEDAKRGVTSVAVTAPINRAGVPVFSRTAVGLAV
jgi:hypothetical protein